MENMDNTRHRELEALVKAAKSGKLKGFIRAIDFVLVVTTSSLTFWNPMDCSPPGFSQARILQWVATSFLMRSSQPRDWTKVSGVPDRFFTTESPGKQRTWGNLIRIFKVESSAGPGLREGQQHCPLWRLSMMLLGSGGEETSQKVVWTQMTATSPTEVSSN